MLILYMKEVKIQMKKIFNYALALAVLAMPIVNHVITLMSGSTRG